MTQCKNLPPVEGGPNPCACCPPIKTQVSLEKVIAVGFGSAQVYRDDEFFADGEHGIMIRNGIREDFEPWTLTFGDVEEIAASEEGEHDWQVVLHGPLHGETYQRQGVGVWICVERNEGFA